VNWDTAALITANGDCLFGDWRDNSLFRASFQKGDINSAPNVVKALLAHSLGAVYKDEVSSFVRSNIQTDRHSLVQFFDHSRNLLN
jgi:hypothetical protein